MSGSIFSLTSASTALLDAGEHATNAAEQLPRRGEPDGGTRAAPAVDDWVAQQIQDAYGVEYVYRDDEGDIPIPFGSCVVFVRSHQHGSPFLELHAQLLADFEMSPEVFGAVNAANAQISLHKVMIDAQARQIYMEGWLLVENLSRRQLLFALEFMADGADHFGPLFQARFGGRLMMDTD